MVVRDYDEALKWYTDVLGWRKVEDRAFGPGQRWIVVAPAMQSNIGIVLDQPNADRSSAGDAADAMRNYSDRIGKETNWVFQVGDCVKLYEILSKRGVKFIAPPRDTTLGHVTGDLRGSVRQRLRGRRAPLPTGVLNMTRDLHFENVYPHPIEKVWAASDRRRCAVPLAHAE